MPYCRRCGTQLAEDARFCHKCGAPVESYIPTSSPARARPIRRDPLVAIAVGAIVIILVAAIVSAVAFAPIYSVNYDQTQQDLHAGIDTINLNFEADIAQINIFTQNLTGQNILINVSAEGRRSILSGDNFIQFTFSNETANNVLTVNSRVSQTGFASAANVVCNILVNPALKLNLNVTSVTGQVSLTADSDTTIQSLNLQTTTGEVQANLDGNITVAGNILLKAQTGAVNYRMNQVNIQGNHSITMESTTGSVTADITEEKTLQGNLQISATTSTGAINLGLQIDDDVAARITSHAPIGNINLDEQGFSGNESLTQSNNYPAASNIEVTNTVNGFGSINITANYASSVSPSARN